MTNTQPKTSRRRLEVDVIVGNRLRKMRNLLGRSSALLKQTNAALAESR